MNLFGKTGKNNDSTPKKEMGFFDHIEELRWTILRSMIAILLLAIGAFLLKKFIFDVVILSPGHTDFITNRFLCKVAHKFNIAGLCYQNSPLKIINLTMGGQFVTHVMVSVIAGFIVAFPYISWEFWKFISPALYEKEKKNTRKAVFFISLLFFMGVAMGYFILTPISISFLISYSISDSIANNISLNSYISFVTSMWFGTGIVFELPVVAYFLTSIGILKPDFMKKNRRIAIVAILFLAAIITPSPDMFCQTLVALPLYLLYEVSIQVSVRVIKKKKQKEKEQEEEI